MPPQLFVHGHQKVYTEDDGLVAIKVNVHEFVENVDRPSTPQGHRLVFHPVEEGRWELRSHQLTQPEGVRVPQSNPSILTSDRGYKTLYEVYETAVAWMERNGYQVLTEDWTE